MSTYRPYVRIQSVLKKEDSRLRYESKRCVQRRWHEFRMWLQGKMSFKFQWPQADLCECSSLGELFILLCALKLQQNGVRCIVFRATFRPGTPDYINWGLSCAPLFGTTNESTLCNLAHTPNRSQDLSGASSLTESTVVDSLADAHEQCLKYGHW